MTSQVAEARSAQLPEPAELESLVKLVLDESKRCGASAAEAGVSMEAGLSVTVRLGEVETLEYHRDRGVGVTVYFGQRCQRIVANNASHSDNRGTSIVN